MVAQAPPTYSDGTGAVPTSETTREGNKQDKRLNFYEAQASGSATAQTWLQKLGALLADTRRNPQAANQRDKIGGLRGRLPPPS